MFNRPNLFSYATSELSQDAFLCWLLAWASPEYRLADEKLHNCSTKFIEALLRKHSRKLQSPIYAVKVERQYKHIDVLCTINEDLVILIESKVDTAHHSGQLSRYLEDVRAIGFGGENIIAIYIKTIPKSSWENVEEAGYKYFGIEDLAGVLSGYRGQNSIINDYREYLEHNLNAMRAYVSMPTNKWDQLQWIGFYADLRRKFAIAGDWGYVPNQRGGFQAFWWHRQIMEDCAIYLQLEEERLCFKVEVEDKEARKPLRSKWHEIILRKARELDVPVSAPKRFGSGQCMTVCILDKDYREATRGALDLERTVRWLKKAEMVLDLAR